MQNARMVECRGLRVEGSINARRGLTLIELLVVIIILTTVVAAAIPILAPSGSDRAIREATRGVNTYITGAQTRATAIRRPFGVALKRLSLDTGRNLPINASNPSNDNGVSLEVYYVEQQPPYSGFDPNSRVCVCRHPSQVGLVLVRFVTRGTPTGPNLPTSWVADLFPSGTIRPGDVIEINGTRYELMSSATPGAPRIDQYTTVVVDKTTGYYVPPTSGIVRITAKPINDSGQLIQPEHDDLGRALRDGPPTTGSPLRQPYWTAPAPYKILRQPTATSDPPYQLPEGTAIDLRASGYGSDEFFYVPGVRDNDDPVVVMFTPEGRIERMYFNTNVGTSTANEKYDDPVVDNVYLLVGKRENIPAPDVNSDPTLSTSGFPPTLTDQQRQELKEPINWLGGESRWVVIGSQSGRVVSIENAFVDPGAVLTVGANSTPPVPSSTELLRSGQILAAREFTFDMANMGGR